MTEEKMNDMKAGQILKLLYTDPGVRPDLVAWCKATKNTLVGFKENKNINSAFIKKAN